ncbi:MAG TPA: hypothetical protein VJW75_05405, partial [Candidatus Eisenbacteria bacterium]|nr:hypothetical protein [Candidatus Eisenbacteria bacterium]
MKRLAGWIALLVLTAAVSGCGEAGSRAARYRAEKMMFDAARSEAEARLGRSRPDTTALLRVRGNFAAVRIAIPPPYIRSKSKDGFAAGVELLRTVGRAELSAARLAMEAGRPDLALEHAEWLSANSEGDTLSRRQADFAAVGALRQARRTEEAIARMHAMLERY